MKLARIKKDRSTPEKDKFWASAEEAIQEVHSWPEWKQNYVSPLLLFGTSEKKIVVGTDRKSAKKKNRFG